MKQVTAICTSFDRPDLLERTLRSFHKFNTYPIARFIVQDDSGHVGCNDHLCAEFPHVEFRYNPKRVGQIRSADIAYTDADTPYIFHLEEDWDFYRFGFIERSMEILEDRGNIICVWLRAHNDVNGHRPEPIPYRSGPSDIEYRVLPYNHARIWHGFTFNPSLRRRSDWKAHGGYAAIASFIPERPWEAEAKIGHYYMRKGFRAAILDPDGYVRHTGDNRGIRG
jgi:GT2 family glycosyltransferase